MARDRARLCLYHRPKSDVVLAANGSVPRWRTDAGNVATPAAARLTAHHTSGTVDAALLRQCACGVCKTWDTVYCF